MARISAVLHGALTPAEILGSLSYADGVRYLNQWWLDAEPGNKLRIARSLVQQSIAGLFSEGG